MKLRNIVLVLDVGAKVLPYITGLQFEMAFEELYKGELLFAEMMEYIKVTGFHLCAFKNGFHNTETGKLYEVDGIFYRMPENTKKINQD